MKAFHEEEGTQSNVYFGKSSLTPGMDEKILQSWELGVGTAAPCKGRWWLALKKQSWVDAGESFRGNTKPGGEWVWGKEMMSFNVSLLRPCSMQAEASRGHSGM